MTRDIVDADNVHLSAMLTNFDMQVARILQLDDEDNYNLLQSIYAKKQGVWIS